MKVLGIEPATEIAKKATESGVYTVADFFTSQLSDKIVEKYGHADIITINNLFANIDNLKEMAKGIRRLIAPGGTLVIESSYLGDMIKNMVFDFIYHEHLSYFSVKPMKRFFRHFDIDLADIERIPTKGGSLRYYFQPKGASNLSPFASKIIEYEERIALDRAEIYKAFSGRIEKAGLELSDTLADIKAEGKSIAGYGGSATSTTLIYHFGLEGFIDYIIDDNPAKHNTFSPGHQIPVLPSDLLYERRPDYVLILAWRYKEPIIDKHRAYLAQGGRFIVPLPRLEII